MSAAADGFTFVAGGRTYACAVETARTGGRGPWWWFTVSGEAHARHAPFRASDDDSADDVRARIVAYYETLLERRAAPAQGPWHSRNRTRPAAAAPAAPADARGA